MVEQRELWWLLPLIPPLSVAGAFFALKRKRLVFALILIFLSSSPLWAIALVVAFFAGADAALAPLCVGIFSAVFSSLAPQLWRSKLPPEERSRPFVVHPWLRWRLQFPCPLTWMMGISLAGAFFGPLFYQSQPPQTLLILATLWLVFTGGTFLYERRSQRRRKGT